jgi:hypothetical protein
MKESRRIFLFLMGMMLLWELVGAAVCLMLVWAVARGMAFAGSVMGWIAPDVPVTVIYELNFVILFTISFLIWVVLIFVVPLWAAAEGAIASLKAEPVSTDASAKATAESGSSGMSAGFELFRRNYITFGSAYWFVVFYAWFAISEYELGGFFFVHAPQSIWNALASAVNILSEGHISKYLENTDVAYRFVDYDSTKIRNKLVVTIAQLFLSLGLLKSIVSVLKMPDAK